MKFDKNDEKLKEAIEHFSKLADPTLPDGVRVARPPSAISKEPLVLKEIIRILGLETPGMRILDIGCGAGFLAKNLVKIAEKTRSKITLMDFDKIISLLSSELLSTYNAIPKHVEVVSGAFPLQESKLGEFDRIIMYSVLHYTDHPGKMIEAAADLLAPGGRLLIADIPNANKKGRFLSTEFGRKFEANYKKIPIEKVPKYSSHQDFASKELAFENNKLNDEFLLNTVIRARQKGFDAYLLEQSSEMPMNLTREDLLITKPFA